MLLSGVVTASNLLLSLMVGMRLVRLGRGRGSGPELWLGGYFLVAAFLGATLHIAVYGSLADPSVTLSPSVTAFLLVGASLAYGIGATAISAFTWLTFRRDEAWAQAFVWIWGGLVLVGLVGQALTEGFALVAFPGFWYWVQWLGRTAPLAWITYESFRYYGMSRRRLRLGLAEPVLTNRFLLWGMWSAAATLNYMADLLARVAYVFMTGETAALVVEAAVPIIVATVASSSLLGVISAVTLMLTFFPTQAYQRWVEARWAPEVA